MLLQRFVLEKNQPGGMYDIEIAVVTHTKCGMSRESGNTLSPVDYIIAEPGENWNAIARRANRGVSVLREANRWADPDQLGVNEVLYVPPPRRSKRWKSS
jgi:hypothetical protein